MEFSFCIVCLTFIHMTPYILLFMVWNGLTIRSKLILTFIQNSLRSSNNVILFLTRPFTLGSCNDALSAVHYNYIVSSFIIIIQSGMPISWYQCSIASTHCHFMISNLMYLAILWIRAIDTIRYYLSCIVILS